MSGNISLIDWGSTNLRVLHLNAAGQEIARHQSADGVARLDRASMARIINQIMSAAPEPPETIYACGMLGSGIGWQEVPYIPCPADADALAVAVEWVDMGGVTVGIVPGVKCFNQRFGWDVMRGEELQVTGWLCSQPQPETVSGLCITPGTHSKWVQVENGKITGFQTSMTGELFAHLKCHGLLRHHITKDATPSETFLKGAHCGLSEKAIGRWLFSIRANSLLNGMSEQQASDFASGLLIGAEMAEGLRDNNADSLETPIQVIGAPALTELYQALLTSLGYQASTLDHLHANKLGFLALHRHTGGKRVA